MRCRLIPLLCYSSKRNSRQFCLQRSYTRKQCNVQPVQWNFHMFQLKIGEQLSLYELLKPFIRRTGRIPDITGDLGVSLIHCEVFMHGKDLCRCSAFWNRLFHNVYTNHNFPHIDAGCRLLERNGCIGQHFCLFFLFVVQWLLRRPRSLQRSCFSPHQFETVWLLPNVPKFHRLKKQFLYRNATGTSDALLQVDRLLQIVENPW